MPYLNVAEIESWTELMGMAHPQLCTRLQLPNLTPEGRGCFAIRVRAGARQTRHGLLFIGNQHAREWGSSDILVDLTDRLITAYEAGTSLAFQGKTYTTAQVSGLLESVDLFIVPCVNPDGRAYSQTSYAMWRKNRRPIPSTPAIGTDLNRNYDFLWDYRTTFDPTMFEDSGFGSLAVNDDPVNDPLQLYHGTAAFSEPETQNILWLFDTYPTIRFLVDVHSFKQIIGHPWGDDDSQSTHPEQNFLNPAFDGARGTWTNGAGYGEYLRAFDASRMNALGLVMDDALRGVRGISYLVGTTYRTVYPTCGTSTCYAFSRHLVDASKNKIDSFLLEWGQTFQPAYDTEMVKIFDDVGAALTALALAADHVPLLQIAPRYVRFPFPRSIKRRPWNAPTTRYLTLTNLGPGEVIVESESVEPGPRSGSFAASVIPPRLVASGETTRVRIIYTPADRSPSATVTNLLINTRTRGAGSSFPDVFIVELRRGAGPARRSRRRPWKRPRLTPPKKRPKPDPRARRRRR